MLYQLFFFVQPPTTCSSKAECAPGEKSGEKRPIVVVVLGGPGSGKGTQCANIVKEFGFVHLSAGDLLRREMDRGGETSQTIKQFINSGRIVPSEITVRLLDNEIRDNSGDKFLIDGFPRNFENNEAFEKIILTHVQFPFLLFFDCPEKILENRLLGRGNASDNKRSDDVIDVIKKRFKTFTDETIPVVNLYRKKNKVISIDANRTREEIFRDLKLVFQTLLTSSQKC